MLSTSIHHDSVSIGKYFNLSFQRTLRIPDDGKTYPLPPGLGRFPVRRVTDYQTRLPQKIVEIGGVFLPIYQREALWLSFDGHSWHPVALKVGVGKINAITGKPWSENLEKPQDYVVIPEQPWLDGINAGKGMIRQFVAMPLGLGYTIEEQLTSKAEFGGIQLKLFEPKPGRFPNEGPTSRYFYECCIQEPSFCSSGIAPGGRMKQKIYPDKYGIKTWDQNVTGRLFVHLLDPRYYAQVTGESLPSTPVDAHTYSKYGMPWFDLYDEDQGDLLPSSILQKVSSVSELEGHKRSSVNPPEVTIDIAGQQILKLHLEPESVKDGKW